MMKMNKKNNTLKVIIKEHGWESKILWQEKVFVNSSLKTMGDAVGEEIETLQKLCAVVEDLIVSGILSEDTQHDEN